MTIWDDIQAERRRQDAKHGPDMDRGRFPSTMAEEFGEACECINDGEPDWRYREELVQCAAVAVKAIEHLDRLATMAQAASDDESHPFRSLDIGMRQAGVCCPTE